jgi:hypothetical protein
MAMSRMRSPHENLLAAAIGDVFGAGRPAISWAVIVVVGLVGWWAGARPDGVQPVAQEWLRPWACAGYGVAAGALMTLLPRALKVLTLNTTLSRRPTGDLASHADSSWPLRLVTAALRHTPLLRMTAQDFTTSLVSLVEEVRGLLSQRLWPACAAAFTAPVLGLVSAWLTWGRTISFIDRQTIDAAAVPFGVVAWPMILTILAGLTVMLAVVVVDQMTRALLQRWSTSMRLEDAAAPAVQAGLAALAAAAPPVAQVVPVPSAGDAALLPPSPQPRPEPAAAPPLTAVDLRGLEDMFRNG